MKSLVSDSATLLVLSDGREKRMPWIYQVQENSIPPYPFGSRTKDTAWVPTSYPYICRIGIILARIVSDTTYHHSSPCRLSARTCNMTVCGIVDSIYCCCRSVGGRRPVLVTPAHLSLESILVTTPSNCGFINRSTLYKENSCFQTFRVTGSTCNILRSALIPHGGDMTVSHP